jgi:hypothetical protein
VEVDKVGGGGGGGGEDGDTERRAQTIPLLGGDAIGREKVKGPLKKKEKLKVVWLLIIRYRRKQLQVPRFALPLR